MQIRKVILIVTAIFFSNVGRAESITIYLDSKIPQIDFAGKDVKTALEAKGHTVTFVILSALKASDTQKRIVIALTSDKKAIEYYTVEKGGTLPILTEQAYALRTTSRNNYWIFGGDVNGVMYGALQLAENITFDKSLGRYNQEESPLILKRGIKLNFPFDEKSLTYEKNSRGASYKNAIPNVWDMTFWSEWFDEMARNRYNVLSVWNNHPFTSMIKMQDYPDVAIQNVTGYDGFTQKMTIDEKIIHWKKVMAYAHSRGFDFLLFNWNLFCGTANGKYGITEGPEGVTNPVTITYMRKCMTTLLETYPDLDGFGITQGENMSKDKKADAEFLASTYGRGFADFAKANPQRKLTFIHRWHMSNFNEMKENFKDLFSLSNVRFEMSSKYSQAHMYSATAPQWWPKSQIDDIKAYNLKLWLTVRNDDFYFNHWGDPSFAREYINAIPGKGDWFTGFYMGSDGFAPTRTFFNKNSISQGVLEIQRQWYMFKIWGRIAYNPATPDKVFKNFMTQKYPTAPTEQLFAAWSKASKGVQKVNELTQGSFKLDWQWYPEMCSSHEGFIPASVFAKTKVTPGSTYCSISETAESKSGGRKNALQVADEVEVDAKEAISMVAKIKADDNSSLGVTLNNIRSLSYLAIYYAYKIRGAVYIAGGENKKREAIVALGKAYTCWLDYVNLMDKLYFPMTMQRTKDIKNWHQYDKEALEDYTSIGGVGVPQ